MRSIIGLYFFLLMRLFVSAQESRFEVRIDRDSIKIGEHFFYMISTLNKGKVIFPRIENLNGLEIVEEFPVDTIEDRLHKRYAITGFDSGAFYVRSQKVFMDAKAYFMDSLLVNVAMVKVDTVKLASFYKVKDLEMEDFTFLEWWYDNQNYVYIVLSVLAFLTLMYFIFRNRKSSVKEKNEISIPPHIRAIEEVKSLEKEKLWKKGALKQHYSELTEIIRRYISEELEIQALEITSEELMVSLKLENEKKKLSLEKEVLDKLKDLLFQADFIKFAKQKLLESQVKEDNLIVLKTVEFIHDSVQKNKEGIENDKD